MARTRGWQYVYWLVQTTTNLAGRAADVERLAAEHHLTADDRRQLDESLANLDARRAAKAQVEAEKKSRPRPAWLDEPATEAQLRAIREYEGDVDLTGLTKGQARGRLLRDRRNQRQLDRLSLDLERVQSSAEAHLVEYEIEELEQQTGQRANHPLPVDWTVQVAGYTLVRDLEHDSAEIVDQHGEIVATHEITSDQHWRRFVLKFQRDASYRQSIVSAVR